MVSKYGSAAITSCEDTERLRSLGNCFNSGKKTWSACVTDRFRAREHLLVSRTIDSRAVYRLFEAVKTHHRRIELADLIPVHPPENLRPFGCSPVSKGEMKIIDADTVREHVRTRYGDIAENSRWGCGSQGCCGNENDYDQQLGYTEAEAASVPESANLGLGCGNPIAIASIRPGETVLDLGSGAGFDCFLAARQLNGTGRVIGVDMTPAMIAKARANARKGGFANVEFRLGEIEALPVADNSIDLVISNCVVNLSPEKPRAFREAFRVLKSGGRLAIADVVVTKPLPVSIRTQLNAISACIGGAAPVDDLKMMLNDAGFVRVEIIPRDETRALITQWTENGDAGEFVVSAFFTAYKP